MCPVIRVKNKRLARGCDCVAVFAASDSDSGTERLVVLAETRLENREHLASLHHDPSHAPSQTERYRPSSMSFFEIAVAHDSSMVDWSTQMVR